MENFKQVTINLRSSSLSGQFNSVVTANSIIGLLPVQWTPS